MKIQLIFDGEFHTASSYGITISKLNAPKSFDSYDINIISLQSESLWRFKRDYNNKLDCTNDLSSIKMMIEASKKAVNIIALPQNYMHCYNAFGPNTYHSNCELKNEIQNLQLVLLAALIPEGFIRSFTLIYENSETTLNEKIFNSAFCFMKSINPITKSNSAEKATTMQLNDRLILTTLDLQSPGVMLDDFIKGIGLDKEPSEIPQWVNDYQFFDDAQQQELISQNQQKIADLQNTIDQAQEKINTNLNYKSILYTNGDELVGVVFDILEKALCCNLSDFVDERKEDFLIKKEDVTFIGEIKGITSNVKSEHISQLDVHYQSYSDYLQENNLSETVKQLLIINPFRTQPLSERKSVHHKQIELAERNECLIITTETLLKIFEKFLKQEIASNEIIKIFKMKSGLLTEQDFNFGEESIDQSTYKV